MQYGDARAAPPPKPPARPAEAGRSGPSLVLGLFSSWMLYESLAEWQLRSQLDPSSYAVARRTLRLVLGLASARPGAVIAAAMTPEPPLFEQRPVDGGVRSGYGVRRDPFKRKQWKKHNGVDLVAERGVPVLAAGPGIVVKAERLRGYGRVVYLDHGSGVQTRYAHLQEINVQEGQFVPPGGLIGKVGASGHATGPHLHFEVRANGKPVAPIEILSLLTAQTPFGEWLVRAMNGEPEGDGRFDYVFEQTPFGEWLERPMNGEPEGDGTFDYVFEPEPVQADPVEKGRSKSHRNRAGQTPAPKSGMRSGRPTS